MKKFIWLTLVLGCVSGIASAALAVTYSQTKGAITAAEKKEEEAALNTVFFAGFKDVKTKTVGDTKLYEVFLKDDSDIPSYYAVTGAGIGYNTAVPIQLLVGFTNPTHPNLKMPDGKPVEKKGFVCIGWKVIKSAETPGLGENAKNTKPAFTWIGKLLGKPDDTSTDRRTKFQKQFEGKIAGDMEAKKNIDIITGATYSTVGIIKAVQEAERKLAAALKK